MQNGTKCTLVKLVKLCEDGADEGCFGTSVDVVLHLFPVDVHNCFIAMVRDEVK